jgi:hypothetical protein
MHDNDRAWVGTHKGLFELRRKGLGWAIEHISFLGDPVSMLLPPLPDGRMLAALNLGHFGVKVHASDDAGKTWREVATPVYPEQPADAEGPPWKLVQVWALEAGGGTVWAGTLPGGLFRSDDFGTTWRLVDSLWRDPRRTEWFGGGADVPGIHSLCLHPQDPQDLILGVSCGGAWRTRDGGATWTLSATGMRADFMPPERAADANIQDPHLIVRCPARPDTLWCQHHNGIWRSTDGAAWWQRVHAPVSSFGFAVAVHPTEPDTAWFVPAVKDECRVPVDGALVVNRTRDGGASWQTLREGLPQQHCYDLVYRHGLGVAADGRTLLMGSTTGGLWTSFDGGDRWQTVSLNLPPIRVLKFG